MTDTEKLILVEIVAELDRQQEAGGAFFDPLAEGVRGSIVAGPDDLDLSHVIIDGYVDLEAVAHAVAAQVEAALLVARLEGRRDREFEIDYARMRTHPAALARLKSYAPVESVARKDDGA